MVYFIKTMGRIIIICFFATSSTVNAQVIEHFEDKGQQIEMIVLPNDFKPTDNLLYVDNVKSGDPFFQKVPTYKNQLHKICIKAVKSGANIIQIMKIENVKWSGSYKLNAKAYKVHDYGAFKKRILDKKVMDIQSRTNYSYLTIYRPNYTSSLNDLYNYTIIISKDTLKLRRNTKYKIRIDKEGITDIKILETKTSYSVDIRFGNDYYVRSYAQFPSAMGYQSNAIMIPIGGYVPLLEKVDKDQAEIESSLIENAP